MHDVHTKTDILKAMLLTWFTASLNCNVNSSWRVVFQISKDHCQPVRQCMWLPSKQDSGEPLVDKGHIFVVHNLGCSKLLCTFPCRSKFWASRMVLPLTCVGNFIVKIFFVTHPLLWNFSNRKIYNVICNMNILWFTVYTNLQCHMYDWKIDDLTYASKPIACVSMVTRAGVTPLSVVASCTVMTAMSASRTFIHICIL